MERRGKEIRKGKLTVNKERKNSDKQGQETRKGEEQKGSNVEERNETRRGKGIVDKEHREEEWIKGKEMERGKKTWEREKPRKGDTDRREAENGRENKYKLRGKNYIFKVAFLSKQKITTK